MDRLLAYLGIWCLAVVWYTCRIGSFFGFWFLVFGNLGRSGKVVTAGLIGVGLYLVGGSSGCSSVVVLSYDDVDDDDDG